MDKFSCVAHGNGPEFRFFVQLMGETDAVTEAKREAAALGHPEVMVENLVTGLIAYDGSSVDVVAAPKF
jgi:hypothetical protein